LYALPGKSASFFGALARAAVGSQAGELRFGRDSGQRRGPVPGRAPGFSQSKSASPGRAKVGTGSRHGAGRLLSPFQGWVVRITSIQGLTPPGYRLPPLPGLRNGHGLAGQTAIGDTYAQYHL